MSTAAQRHESLPRPIDALPPLIPILRPHLWLNNPLVIMPAVAAHRIDWTTGRSRIALVVVKWGVGILISITALPVAFAWTLAIDIAETAAV
jgi:hypothetical protein